MITLLLIFLPALAAGLAWFLKRRENALRTLLCGTAVGHSILYSLLYLAPELEKKVAPAVFQWVGQDELSRIFLGVTSFLFLAVSIHTACWLPAEQRSRHGGGLLASHVFVSCLLAFLSTMTLVISARNFGLLWVAVEATTLVSAPLILFHRSGHSLEAMWKYLLICSVGIGLALFGTMLLAVAGRVDHLGLGLENLRNLSAKLDPAWFKASFLFILAGYGTKMGLAPFHTWLPDAHSEAPGTVSALLSGSLLNCSFLGIVRFLEIAPAPLAPFCRSLLVALGLLSLAVAAFFIVRQTDYKRMLAYSSVEHIGLIAVMWAIAPKNIALIHLCGHSVIKMTLFLLAGNILLACGTRKISDVGGLFGSIPRNAGLWVFCCLMICGLPPSPLFVTEFLLVYYAGWKLGAVVLTLLFAVFAGMTMTALKMTMGDPGKANPDRESAVRAENLWPVPMFSAGLVLFVGAWLAYFTMKGL